MSKMLLTEGEVVQEVKKPLNGLTIASFIIATATAATLGIGAVAAAVNNEYKELKNEIKESNRHRRHWDWDDDEDAYRYRRRRNRDVDNTCSKE